jgi:hypothetical protein
MDARSEAILDAYLSLGEGDASPLIALLDPAIEWSAAGTVEVGRDTVARHLEAGAGRHVEVIGVRRSVDTLVLEFTRPWWKPRSRTADTARSIFGIRGEQSLLIKDGFVRRIESRESLARAGD